MLAVGNPLYVPKLLNPKFPDPGSESVVFVR